MGKAVVAPAMENIRDIVDDGETGLLFESGSAAALTARLTQLKGDPMRRHELGLRARARVMEKFTWKSNARRVVDEAAIALGWVPVSAGNIPACRRRLADSPATQQPIRE